MTTIERVQPVPQPIPRRGLKRFLLGCAGANQQVLALCPSEVEKYVGLGSAVLISSALAMVSGTVAFATAAGGGDDLARWMAICLPLGLVYGAIVFAIDRFLVSSSMNPVSPAGLAGGDEAGHQRAGVLRRFGEVAQTLAAAAPRLVLAGLIGVLVAEPVLLVVFRREIDQRVVQIQAAQLDEAAERIDSRYADELERISSREAELALVGEPLTEALDELADVDDEIDVVEVDLAERQLLLRNEIAGVAIGDGGAQTTGRTGDGPVADELRAEIELLQTRLDGLTSRREAQQLRVDELGASRQVDRSESASAELVALSDERRDLADARQQALDEAAVTTAGAGGLLTRIEALEWLTSNELTPATVGGDEPGAGDAAAVAGGLTTVGIAVWLVRLWVLVLDAIPIGFKVLLSLRSHRPYDTVLAAHQAAELDLARALLAGESPAEGTDRLLAVTGQLPIVRVPHDGAGNGNGSATEPDRTAPSERPTGARYLSPSGSLGRFTPGDR